MHLTTLPKFSILLLFTVLSCTHSSMFTITNNCPFTMAWNPSRFRDTTTSNNRVSTRLWSESKDSNSSRVVWIWARTGCNFDESGIGTCQTGDCGGRLECDGVGATPPASLFEITLGQGTDKDFYDVSIVDGYNLPLIVAPRGQCGVCNVTGCSSDINMACPKELQVVDADREDGGVVACKSACEAFGLDQYCCSGEFANPTTCQPSYSTIFKRACPRAYSYAFDDGSSTFTCKGFDYAIVFCSTINDGMKRSDSTFTNPSIQEHGNGEVMGITSSSTMLLPLP
ncbi:LOW QUALITY PROTEIN: Thaumatin family, partial [Dillenia turbinata]